MKSNTPINSILNEVAPQGIIHNFNIYKKIRNPVMKKFIFSKYIAVLELKQHNKDSIAISFIYLLLFFVLTYFLFTIKIMFNKIKMNKLLFI